MKLLRLVRVVSVMLIAVFAGLLIYERMYPKRIIAGDSVKYESSNQGDIGGAFSLIDAEGKTVTDKDFAGKYMLVYFGFTSCPEICPTDLVKIGKVIGELGKKASEVQPIFITLDPERDTQERLKTFSADFNPAIRFLTGSRNEINNVLAEYKVYNEKMENQSNPADYMFNHSTFIYLMGREGKYITHFSIENTTQQISARILNEMGE